MAIGGAVSKITVEIGGKLGASLTASLRSAQQQVSTFSRNVNRTINDAATAGAKGFKGMIRSDAFQAAATAAAGIGLALGGSIRTAARFEGVVSDIGKTANASQTELKALGMQLRGLSVRSKTNLAPTVLAAGVQDLVAQGLELNDAVASIEALGKVATATGSELTDVTKTGFQLQNALKIRPTELQATFDALAYAGKQGAFELKDMAQFMPTIAAAAGTLGIQGRKGAVSLASMMQMVRKDAPDAGQAATRLTDAMLKMTAPQTVKGFAKFGINIEKVLKNAQKKGINPMEAAIDTLQKVTGGDSFKLSQIFGDKEAKLALMSLMKYRKEYAKLRDEAGGDAAKGTVETDYLKSLDTFNGRMNTFKSATESLGIVLGNALMPPLSKLAEFLTPIVEGIGRAADKFPVATSVVVGLAAAFAGLVAVSPFIASFISVLGALKMAIATTSLGATIAGWAGAVGPAMAAIGTAITGPIGIAVLAIVGLGLAFKAAYDKIPAFKKGVDSALGGISARFKATWTAIKGGFGGLMNYLGGIGKMIAGVFQLNPSLISAGFNQALGGAKTMLSSWLGWIRAMIPSGFRSAFNGALSAVTGAIGRIKAAIVSIGQALWSGGLSQIVQGFQTAFQGVVNVVKGVWQVIVGIFTGDSKMAVQGVKTAFAGLSGIWSGLGSMAQGAFNLIKTSASMMASGIISAAMAIPPMFSSIWNQVKAAAVAAFNGLVAFIRSVPGMLVDVGAKIIDTIINGIRARASALVETVRATFAEVRKLMPFSDAKEGPFRYLTSSGKAIITTLSHGVGEASPRLSKAMHESATAAMQTFKDASSGLGVTPAINQAEQPESVAPQQPQLTAAGVAMRSVPVIPQYAPPQQEKRGGGLLQGLMPVFSRLMDRFAPQAKGYLTMGQTLLGSLKEGNILPSLEAGIGAATRGFLPQASEFVAPLMRGLGAMQPQMQPALAGIPAPAPAATRAAGPVSMNPTINVNVEGTNANPQDIADTVLRAFQGMLGDAEAGVRAFLND